MIRYSLLPALLLATAAFGAPAATPQPGTYIRPQASGTLTVRKDSAKALVFEIESTGANCHSCSLTGTIRGTQGYASNSTGAPDSQCEVSFARMSAGLSVAGATQGCRSYCGARADFDGDYKIAPASCTGERIKTQRSQFLRLYQTHDYGKAGNVLTALLSQCTDFLDWMEIDDVRNDLALAQYHSGEPGQCRKTLDATRAGEYANEASLKENFPPCDAENYIKVAKAVWHNKALCASGKTEKR